MELPIVTGDPTGPRGGIHLDRGSNIPTPRYHQYRVTHAGSYLRTRVLSEGVLYPHVGGITVTHRSHC